jgi:hypothetical protein
LYKNQPTSRKRDREVEHDLELQGLRLHDDRHVPRRKVALFFNLYEQPSNRPEGFSAPRFPKEQLSRYAKTAFDTYQTEFFE